MKMSNNLIFRTIIILTVSWFSHEAYAQHIISHTYKEAAFPMAGKNEVAQVLYDNNEPNVVAIASKLFAEDIHKITEKHPEIINDTDDAGNFILIAGTIGYSGIIDRLIEQQMINPSLIDQWESYQYFHIQNPFPHVGEALVVAGSDPRGTAYGLMDLTRSMGVSPWEWWADVTPEKHEEIYITLKDQKIHSPSVKYRGIFLNDEDWGLQPWAAHTFEPETGDIGPKTYAKIFELMLRLKANLIWPAMHNTTKAFYHYPENKKVADDYAVIIGSSHAEPMLRNNVDEWDKDKFGPYNYNTNRQAIYNYWEQRAIESNPYENVYTIGMRGIHDSHMEGFNTVESRVAALEKIIADQRTILQAHVNTNVQAVPQAFIPYKEVLELYDAGLKLPDDVTIVWPDDNYGYIRRLNAPEEMDRDGGTGVYYHISYWGRPHDYLWLSTTHPGLIRQEMTKAYNYGVQHMWVLNVGDIKPAEINIQFFMDMAWDIEPFLESTYTRKYLDNWFTATFNQGISHELTEIMWNYYQLAFERRPEFMGFNQVEPTRLVNQSDYNHYFHNDQAAQRLKHYQQLTNGVEQLKDQIAPEKLDAFYQLVYYPVIAAASMNSHRLLLEKAYLYGARQQRASANDYVAGAKQAYNRIVQETEYYNNVLADGKWKEMMYHKPRELPVFQEPVYPVWEVPENDRWGIAMEGSGEERHRPDMIGLRYYLPDIYTWANTKRFIDIYLKGSETINWHVSTSHEWIKVNQTSGTLRNAKDEKEVRVWVSVDKEQMPRKTETGYITIEGPDNSFRVRVSAHNKPAVNTMERILGVEQNGRITMYAENYSDIRQQEGSAWEKLHDLGHSGSALMSMVDTPPEAAFQKEDLSEMGWVEYDFFTQRTGEASLEITALPTHPVNKNSSVAIAVSVNGSTPQVLDFVTHGRSEQWKQNVLGNTATVQIPFKLNKRDKHTVRIYAVDPAVILDYITIYTGGTEGRGYGMVRETSLAP